MNDFAAMMAASGTRPLAERAPQQRSHRTHHQPRPMPQPVPVQAPPLPRACAPDWAIGAEGRAILERAMRGISRNGALTRPNGQIVMLVRKDGQLVDAGDPPNVVTPADILALSDRIGCELIVISWSGRKAVFHPLSGAAVLTEDPKGE